MSSELKLRAQLLVAYFTAPGLLRAAVSLMLLLGLQAVKRLVTRTTVVLLTGRVYFHVISQIILVIEHFITNRTFKLFS